MDKPFGRALRALWDLEPEATFLNHGSFGACPREVLAEQARIRAQMESAPDAFFRGAVMPREDGSLSPLRAAIGRLGEIIGAGPGALALVENATSGVQAALDSVPLRPGDRILITDHTYNAVRLLVEARCAQAGATPLVVHLPLPAREEDILQRFRDALTPAVRVAIVDHITSPTALVLPLARLVPEVRRFGARVIVDGAHAVGQVALDLAALGADWYVSNAHKWLFAPRGCAFLYAAPEAAGTTRPLVVSHFVERGFPDAFDWVGTRDYSPWLCLPAAIDFHARFDPGAVARHRSALLDAAEAGLSRLGARAVAPASMNASMRSFTLPVDRPATREDAVGLMRSVWEEERVQTMAVAFGPALLVRVSAQVYVEAGEVHGLAAALDRVGWPGRPRSGASG